MVPINRRSVQIHNLHGHFVVSCQYDCSLKVYDSLNCKQRISQLMPQLRLLCQCFTNHELQVEYIIPQSRGMSEDCGNFTTVNAISFLKREIPPNNVNHLHRCLLNGKITDFPRCPQQIELFQKYMYDQKYKELQQKMTTEIKRKQIERRNNEQTMTPSQLQETVDKETK